MSTTFFSCALEREQPDSVPETSEASARAPVPMPAPSPLGHLPLSVSLLIIISTGGWRSKARRLNSNQSFCYLLPGSWRGRGGIQSLRCNLQAEMSLGNCQEISYTFPLWPSSSTRNSGGTFHEGIEQPP